MENTFSNNVSMYLNNQIQLKNKQMGSPFSMRRGGQYNLHQMMSPPFDSYTLDNLENIDPQILMPLSSSSSSSGDNFSTPSAQNRTRYCGRYERSPLSVVESCGNSTSSSANKSPSVFTNTPMTMEDDVLVMDGISVVNALGGRSRSGKDSVGSSSSSVKSYKMDVCYMWEETGSCRLGSRCQYLHRKEDMSLTGISTKSRPELKISLERCPFNNSSLSNFRGHNSSPPMSRAVAYGRSSRGSATSGSSADGSGNRGSRGCITSRDDPSSFTHSDWVPQDDGIDARPPGLHNPSRDQVYEYMNSYLYAPLVKNQLPVFASICHDVPSTLKIIGSTSLPPMDKLLFELKR